MINSAGGVLAAVLGVVGVVVSALITAHNPGIARALGGGTPTVVATVPPGASTTPGGATVTSDSPSPAAAGYLLDMDWIDYTTGNGGSSLVTGLAIMNGRRYPKSFTTGRCYVYEVIVKLPQSRYKNLHGVVGYQDDATDRELATVEIQTTTDTDLSSAQWNVLDSIEVSDGAPVKAFEENLPVGTTGVELDTKRTGCVPDISWGDPVVS